MADEKRVVRTAGVAGTFVLPGLGEPTDDGPSDLVITPEGIEVTREQWDSVAKAATENHVIVRLDEEFPVAKTAAPEQPSTDEGTSGPQTQEEATGSPGQGTEVDQQTPSTATRRQARNGG